MRHTLESTMIAAVLLSALSAHSAPRIVTAGEVNGTWTGESGAFKVWALGRQRLKVEFSGVREHGAMTANTGEARGIAHIDGDTAVFAPRGAARCRIEMKFERARLVASEDGACGFGLNVTAEGTYTRSSRRKPRFDD